MDAHPHLACCGIQAPYLVLDAMEVAPERLKPLRTLTEGLQGRRK